MPLPIVKEGIKGSLFHKITQSHKGHLHEFFVQEAERIRAHNPVVVSAIEFFSNDDTLVVEMQDRNLLANMPSELRGGIERRMFDLAIKVYLLLESQAEADDLEKEI